jgi:hypothetical protein
MLAIVSIADSMCFYHLHTSVLASFLTQTCEIMIGDRDDHFGKNRKRGKRSNNSK